MRATNAYTFTPNSAVIQFTVNLNFRNKLYSVFQYDKYICKNSLWDIHGEQKIVHISGKKVPSL